MGYYDGKAAWAALVAMGQPSTQLPGEPNVFEMRLATMDLKKIAANADADTYAKRVPRG